jgi:hypothetical protein
MSNMRKIWIESDAADYVSYDRAERTLRIWYKTGRVYDYLDVPSQVYQDLMNADSKGKYINWEIKPLFGYREVGGISA